MGLICDTCVTGRLGNRITMAANVLAFAREVGHLAILPALAPHAELFAGSSRLLVSTQGSTPRTGGGIVQRFALKQAHRASSLLRSQPWLQRVLESTPGVRVWPEYPSYRNMLPQHPNAAPTPCFCTLVVGYQYRCVDLVNRHAGWLRQYFTPQDRWRRIIHEKTGLALDRNSSTEAWVGVHIRKGDYRAWRGGKYFFEDDAYAASMARLEQLLHPRRTRFVLCSDEPIVASAYEAFDWRPGPGSVTLDYLSLFGCHYLISTTSSFSRTASFLSNTPCYVLSQDRRLEALDDLVIEGLY
ncbi:MAG: hypothetical protein AAF750_02745 [Planctomycetota bacterium]